MDYALGFARLRTCLKTRDPDLLVTLATLENRFSRNQDRERTFGTTPETKSDHAQIIHALNQLALENCASSFNDLCGGAGELAPAAATLRVPPPPDTFAGRTAELQKLTEVLLRNQAAAISAAVPGMGGVGKTTLALKLASDLAPQFPGGVVWLEAGYGAGQSDLVDRLARTLGIDLAQEPLVEKRAVILQSVLAGRGRVLVILDDLWDIDLGRWAGKALLPADRVLLVTSRDVALCRALCNHVQRLDVLPEGEALELLAKLLGPLGRHEAAAKDLVKLLDGHPLALEIAARRCDNGVEDLPWVVRKIRANPTLGELKLPGQESRESSVEMSLALSYGDLDPNLRQRFRALSVFAPAPFDLAGLAAVWEMGSVEEAEEIARHLVRRALLASEMGGDGPLYRQHMLLRAYAWALLEQAGELEVTAARHVAYYEVLPGRQAEHWQAAEAFWEQIEQGWQHAWRAGMKVAFSFYKAASFFLYRRSRHITHIEWASALLERQAKQITDEDRAGIFNNMGEAFRATGQPMRALELFEQALPILREVNNRAGEAITINNMAIVLYATGQPTRALELFEQALPIVREMGNRASEAMILNNMGGVYQATRQPVRALELFEQALPIKREVGDRFGEAMILNNIGEVYRATEQLVLALQLYEQALPIYRQVGGKTGEAITLNNMGLVYADLDDKPRALELYELARTIFREVGDRASEAATIHNIGDVHSAMGDKPRALELYEQALSLRCEVGDRWGESITRYNTAMVYKSLNRLDEAEAQLLTVVALDEAIGHPDLESNRAALEEVQAARHAQSTNF